MALGLDTTASGDDSVALGNGTTTSQDQAFAAGLGTTSSGFASTAMGLNLIGTLEASGDGSLAAGYSFVGAIEAAGKGSLAGGYAFITGIEAVGTGSLAWGYSDTHFAAGDAEADFGAIALGYNVQSLAEASVTLGKNLINYKANSVLVQDFNALGNVNIDGNYGAYGELWCSYSTHAIVLPAQDTYVIVGGDQNAGDFYNTTPDPDQNRIIINQDGMYLINLSTSFTGTTNTTWDFAIFINGAMGGDVRDRDMHMSRTTAVNQEGAIPLSGTKRLSRGDYVDFRVERTTGGGSAKTITFSNLNLAITRIG